MPHKHSNLSVIRRIAGKEVSLFFASPIAYLFLATFAAVTLFVFFWGEAFFARNIADVRPLFEWMPVLLIFLCSTLTMRLWSDERRTGTLEHVLTQPVPLWHFVAGKFVGCLLLLAIALAITLPLPISVAMIGDLDWGPVWAGYLATFMLGAAYLSIGLFVSARSDNQIVSLISATALCGVFYLIGTSIITDLFGNRLGEWLRLLGTGSRFDAITRGVVDLRDLYYYLSIIAVFLTLNTFSLERERWAATSQRPHHGSWRVVTALLLVNAIGANFWLGQVDSLRVDSTEGNQYSISDATRGYLNHLQEPLLLRGYFSSKTHPLLSPLVPQLRDLMREYEIAGNGQVRVEIVDPVTQPELEKEANQKFGIQPVPFQVADRYESSIVSSYFNVVVQYGDQHQVLGFRDLIEVKADQGANIEVRLRNPEHDLTQAIKKVLHTYQAGGNLFDTVKGELVFNAYVSDNDALPEPLASFRGEMTAVLDEYRKQADGRLQIKFANPDTDGELAQQIASDYGFQPMATNLFSDDTFYFYMTLSQGDQVVQIPLADMTETSFEQNLEAGIKRFASGFTKTVALVTPPENPGYGRFGGGGPQFNQLQSFLGTELNVQSEDLSDGSVAGDADILLLVSPENLDETAVFAVDQFLMKGGTVIAATSPFSASFGRTLGLQKHNSGLTDWLAHHGLSIGDSLVLDPQNAAFPVPVTRNVGGFQLREIRMLDYPYFADLRGDGLNQDNMITANLPQLTMAWASPIEVTSTLQGEREVTPLLRSSPQSWLSTSTQVTPQIDDSGGSSFMPQGERDSHLLGVISEGRFESYFAGKESPLLSQAADASGNQTADESTAKADSDTETPVISSVIEHSPESSRIILFSSNDFLSDRVIQMAGAASRSQYLGSLQLVANTVDWALEDRALLSLRGQGHFNRTLPPMTHSSQLFWEYLNYFLAAAALVLIAAIQRQRKKSRERYYLSQLKLTQLNPQQAH